MKECISIPDVIMIAIVLWLCGVVFGAGLTTMITGMLIKKDRISQPLQFKIRENRRKV